MAFKLEYLDNDNSNKNKAAKKRNKIFKTVKEIQLLYPDSEAVLEQIFISRHLKTDNRCPGHRGRYCRKLVSEYKKIENKLAYRCGCGLKVYPLKGTPFEHSRVPLKSIIDIMYLMFNSKHGLCATELQRISGCKYETAHKILCKISDLMGLCVLSVPFKNDSVIEVDEVYPKIRTGFGRGHKYKRGAGSERTQPVLVFKERGGLTKGFVIDNVNRETIEPLFEKYVSKSNIIYTDQHKVYSFLKPLLYNHLSVDHEHREYVSKKDKNCHTNTVENFNRFIKTSTHRVHNGVSREYLQTYVNRMAFNNSFKDCDASESITKLINCLPPLFQNGIRRVKSNPYQAPEWQEAA